MNKLIARILIVILSMLSVAPANAAIPDSVASEHAAQIEPIAFSSGELAELQEAEIAAWGLGQTVGGAEEGGVNVLGLLGAILIYSLPAIAAYYMLD